MNKIESVLGKRMFTTVSVHKKIIENVQQLPKIDWSKQQYNYLYIIHKIINHNTRNYKKDTGCLINEEYLAKKYGKSNQQTAEIFRNLIKWKIIFISEPADSEKHISTRYQLTTNYINDNIYMINVPINQVSFINKLIDEEVKYGFESNNTEELSNIKYDPIEDKFCSETIKILKDSLTVNNKGLLFLYNKYILPNNVNNETSFNDIPIDGYPILKSAFLPSKMDFSHLINNKKNGRGYGIERRDIPLFLILIGEFYCTRPPDFNKKKSRVYNNLTNLPRDHRQYLHFGGKPMLMTDISNSQILLTVPIIENHYKIHSGKGAVGIPDDVLKFKQWAESGTFYEEYGKLLTPMTLTNEQRNELKVAIFRNIWFGENHRYVPKTKKIFRKNFPNVFKIITDLKIVDHAQFSIKLQHFEAQIMVDTVAKKMLKRPVLTLHDAIICPDEKVLQEAETRITAALKKYNIVPKFKREDESKYNSSNISAGDLENREVDIVTKPSVLSRLKEIKPLEKRTYKAPPISEDIFMPAGDLGILRYYLKPDRPKKKKRKKENK